MCEKSWRLSVVIFLLGVCILSHANATQPSDVKIYLNGLRIVKPLPNSMQELRAFNWSPGTSVALLLSSPDGGILKIDRDNSKVTTFVDNKHGDLMKVVTSSRFGNNRAGIGMMPSISKDGTKCSFEVNAPGVPTKGATKLKVSGTLALVKATQKKEYTAANVVFKVGTVIKAGPIPFTVKKLGKPQWGDAVFTVTFEAKQSLDSVAEIQFYDVTSGKKLDAKGGMTSRSSFGSQVTETRAYNFKKRVGSAKVVITYWTDKHNVTVPFSKVIDLGL